MALPANNVNVSKSGWGVSGGGFMACQTATLFNCLAICAA
jgi:hypothetical protein